MELQTADARYEKTWHQFLRELGRHPTLRLAAYLRLKHVNAARLKLARWFNKVEQMGTDAFYTVIDTFYNHYDTILNFFVNRATNAGAESFNAKVKAFRAQFRGVNDIPFFLFRLMKLCA